MCVRRVRGKSLYIYVYVYACICIRYVCEESSWKEFVRGRRACIMHTLVDLLNEVVQSESVCIYLYICSCRDFEFVRQFVETGGHAL